jgi:hypothetical protein
MDMVVGLMKSRKYRRTKTIIVLILWREWARRFDIPLAVIVLSQEDRNAVLRDVCNFVVLIVGRGISEFWLLLDLDTLHHSFVYKLIELLRLNGLRNYPNKYTLPK